jgi:hypothetical protein
MIALGGTTTAAFSSGAVGRRGGADRPAGLGTIEAGAETPAFVVRGRHPGRVVGWRAPGLAVFARRPARSAIGPAADRRPPGRRATE